MKEYPKPFRTVAELGHYRKDPVETGPERCAKPGCGWTSEYPVKEGQPVNNGNSFYNYHTIQKLH